MFQEVLEGSIMYQNASEYKRIDQTDIEVSKMSQKVSECFRILKN